MNEKKKKCETKTILNFILGQSSWLVTNTTLKQNETEKKIVGNKGGRNKWINIFFSIFIHCYMIKVRFKLYENAFLGLVLYFRTLRWIVNHVLSVVNSFIIITKSKNGYALSEDNEVMFTNIGDWIT